MRGKRVRMGRLPHDSTIILQYSHAVLGECPAIFLHGLAVAPLARVAIAKQAVQAMQQHSVFGFCDLGVDVVGYLIENIALSDEMPILMRRQFDLPGLHTHPRNAEAQTVVIGLVFELLQRGIERFVARRVELRLVLGMRLLAACLF
jgi:hypothetical protein